MPDLQKFKKIALLLEGHDHDDHWKTAIGLLRYGPYKVVAGIDSDHAGRTLDDLIGFGGCIPIFATIQDALNRVGRFDALFVAVSHPGGQLVPEMRPPIREALMAHVSVVSGLHTILSQDPELIALATKWKTPIVDVRTLGEYGNPPRHVEHRIGTRTIAVVGSDCAVGKMTTTFALHIEATRRGIRSGVAATGQTGIMIAGHGVPVDHTVADFTIGLVAEYVASLTQAHDLVVVEGQGGITHGNIALGIIQGANPDAFILCHDVSRTYIKGYPMWNVPSLKRLRQIYEEIGTWVRETNPAHVIGVSLNTSSLTEKEATKLIKKTEDDLGLPVTDPTRMGVSALVDKIAFVRPYVGGDTDRDSERLTNC